MQRKFLSLITMVLMFLAFSGCSIKQAIVTKTGNSEKLAVAATIFPLYDLLSRVGGDRAKVSLILESGASPHTYEASPGKIKELAGTRALFAVGAGLDDWATDIASALPSTEVFKMDRYAALKPFDAKEHDHEEEHEQDKKDVQEHGSDDPHYWLDPQQSRALLDGISDELGRLDPVNAQYYKDNASGYALQIEARIPIWQEKLAGLDSKDLAIFHDAWSYFASAFGLKIVFSFEPFPGQTPSPAYLAKIYEEAKEHDVKTLFVEPQFSAEAVGTIAADLGLKVGVLDPLGGTANTANYIDLIDYNVETIYQNLNE